VSAAPLANSTADGLFSSPRQMKRYLPCRSKVSTGSGLPSLWPSAPRRPPDHVRENSALAALVSAVADSPRTILQTLADKLLEVLDADSASLSLLTKDGNRFYWAAIAGAWRPHLGGGTPRDFGACAVLRTTGAG
jgi:hypothetical protein